MRICVVIIITMVRMKQRTAKRAFLSPEVQKFGFLSDFWRAVVKRENGDREESCGQRKKKTGMRDSSLAPFSHFTIARQKVRFSDYWRRKELFCSLET